MKRILAIFFFATLGGIIAVNAQIQEGRGTWYETESKGLTASHANLPLGTRVRVTNLQNDKSVIVTINNRIVETPNRLIDISKAAADNVEMNARGTTPVRIEVLSRRSATPASTTNTITTTTTTVPTTTPVTTPVTTTPTTVPVSTVAEDPPPQAEPPNEALTVTTTATAQRPVATQETPAPTPAPTTTQTPTSTNPGIVNQTIITINGTPVASGQSGNPVAVSTSPPYVNTPEGAAAIADTQPAVVSPAFAAPAPAVVSPNPAVVAPAPAVVAPAPAVIAPVIVPPVIAQPVLTPPVLVPPVVAEPIVSEPIVSEPIFTEPIRSNPVTVPSSARNTQERVPQDSSMRQAPAMPRSGAVPARILPRLPNPVSHVVYRVQVGAFLDQRNAVDAYNRLAAAGFAPAYERYYDYYRVVLTGIRASEIENIAWRLGAANFPEALLREER
jgi:hypothetical protein